MAYQGSSTQHESWGHRLLVGLLGISVLTTSYIFLACFYNIALHPLKHLKGPPLARISKIWGRIGRIYGCKSQRIHEAHLKYGPVVRIGPNEISFADPHAVRQIYTSENFVKEETFYWAKKIFREDHLVSFRDPVAHKKRRKLFSRGFSQATLFDFESKMSSKIQTMFDHWARMSLGSNSAIDAYPWAHWLGFDTVYHLMFDEDLGSISAGKPPHLMPHLRAWRLTETYKLLIPALESWGPWVPGPVGSHFRKVREWKELAVSIIKRYRTHQASTPLLRSVLSGEKDDHLGRELTDSELAEECMGAMFGGSGTTANTFVYLLWACLQRKEVVTELRKELREMVQDWHVVPDFLACQSLPYLQAVINETLRLYPTIIATLPRTAITETTVAGVRIPAGTTVGTQNLTIHQDPIAFPQPTEFRPERWLSRDEANEAMKAAWVPFSVGPRRCIGINLALMELSKLVAAFFLRFEHAELDSLMTEQEMRMFDTFSARPIGGRLLIRVRESQPSTRLGM